MSQADGTKRSWSVLLVLLSVVIRSECVLNQNYALNQSAVQSSINGGLDCYKAPHATDGLLGQSPGDCHCAHTNDDTPWWRVQLSRWIRISSVTIYYRDQAITNDIGYGLNVGPFTQSATVFDQSRFELLYTLTSSMSALPNRIGFFNVSSLTGTGRYFAVTGNPNNVVLCEVQVYGSPNLMLGVTGITVNSEDPIYQQRLALRPQVLTDEDENTCITVFDAGRGFMLSLQIPHTAGGNYTAGIVTDGTVSIDKRLPASDNMMVVAVGTSRGYTDCQLLVVRTGGTKKYHQFQCSCTDCSGTATVLLWRVGYSAGPLQLCEFTIFRN